MGLPLLSGPGAIATVMVLVGKAKDTSQHIVLFAVIARVSVMTLLMLRSATMLARVLGTTGINVIGRVMGLILAAIAMQFVLDGLHEAFPVLLGCRPRRAADPPERKVTHKEKAPDFARAFARPQGGRVSRTHVRRLTRVGADDAIAKGLDESRLPPRSRRDRGPRGHRRRRPSRPSGARRRGTRS